VKKQNILFAILILVLLAIQFGLKPHLNRREVLKNANEVLTLMQESKYDEVLGFWETPTKSTPFEGVNSYEIVGKRFNQKDGAQEAFITVKLDFANNQFFPSGRNWLIEFKLTKLGWKIISFSLIK
jgi:hypothetical protein